MISRMKLAKFSAKLVANLWQSLAGYFRASFAGENHQKHFPPKLHRKFHHQISLRGSGLRRALQLPFPCSSNKRKVPGTNSPEGLSMIVNKHNYRISLLSHMRFESVLTTSRSKKGVY